MNKHIILLATLFLVVGCYSAKGQSRNRLSFNEAWLFEKTEDSTACEAGYADADWRQLSLPHDWAIEGPFQAAYNPRTGGLPVSGQAWYRKHFTLEPSRKGSIITIEFDGVMNNSTLYLNGKEIYKRPNGYIGFEIDLTPHIHFGKENVMAVKVNPEFLAARWYPGAGIFRNVWLEMKNPVHVQHWGTHISTPVVSPEKAQVQVEIQLANKQSDWSGSYQIKTSLMDVDGQEVASAASDFEFSAGAGSLIQQLAVKRPRLWGFETPHLYQAVSSISRDGKVLDTYTTSFGIRTIAFTREGFFLNGKREKIKGVCLHHDLGPLGAAVNDRATARQLEIMKAMGVNAIRTAHNPTSPEQLALCDKMGILVQAEAFDCWELPKTENDYHKYWAAWHEQDLRDMIRRDRNHPAIIMWSIGNEVGEQRTDNGRFIAQKLVQICKEEDPYRPTTAGFNHLTAALKNGLADEVDLIGANYKPTQYEEVRARNPEWIVYGSETASCVSSRGVYHLPLAKYNKHESLQISSYDIQSPPWAYPPDVEFHFQDSLPGMIGEFVWTGFDYLGEPTPYGGKDNLTHGNWDVDWPSRSSYFGIVDLAGFPKDRFYLYQSQWTTAPMVHLLPHWNWEGKGVTEIPVYCYTNCEEAELFVNGKSQGRKKMGVDKTRIPVAFGAWGKRPRYFDSPYRLHWNVSYEPGEIEVLAYRGGKVVAQTSIKTAKEPANILLTADREIIQANGEDLSFITVKIMDENSIFCPLANNKIDFTLEGPATIAAVGNGNAASTAPFQAPFRNAFNGLCLLVIRSEKGKTGEVKIHASSPGLAPQSITIMTK